MKPLGTAAILTSLWLATAESEVPAVSPSAGNGVAMEQQVRDLPDPKRAVYCNVQWRYKFDNEQLDLMRAALARLENPNSRQNEDGK